MDVDVNSSSVAANIVGLVQGVTKKLWVDMAIVLEGHSIEELPEMLLGSVRCAHLDLDSAKLLDTTTGESATVTFSIASQCKHKHHSDSRVNHPESNNSEPYVVPTFL